MQTSLLLAHTPTKADDYGFNDISYHARINGNDTNIIETPNMDALAATGVKLENYYVQVSWQAGHARVCHVCHAMFEKKKKI